MKRMNWKIVIALIPVIFAAVRVIEKARESTSVDDATLSVPTRRSETSSPSPTRRQDRAEEKLPIHLALGNPSGAKDDPTSKNDFLLVKPWYALSYNNGRGTPNWVSWALKADEIGDAPRPPDFSDDQTLPRGFKIITTKDYSGSGFDRGHMCPHGDRASDHKASNTTFVMTNIIPQSPNCNQKAWNDFEEYCRAQVKSHKGSILYQICGPVGTGGVGRNGERRIETIGNGRVTVPEKCWKVTLLVEFAKGDATDADRVRKSSRMIAVIMPNDMSVKDGWADYRVSVKEVEKLTGLKFFDRVPKEIAEDLKEKVDDARIPPPREKHWKR